MKNIKTLLFTKFKIIFFLTVLMGLSIVLLMIRLKMAQSYFLLFLVWNLFLAVIPFVVTLFLELKAKHRKSTLLIWFTIWLLFLPNAPYIITDLLHLQADVPKILWFDTLLIISFAFTGLVLYFFSVVAMESVLKKHFKPVILRFLFFTIPFITGFGIYMGRFLRWNTWDIVSNPVSLLADVSEIILLPMSHLNAWYFLVGFGLFLNLGTAFFRKIAPHYTEEIK